MLAETLDRPTTTTNWRAHPDDQPSLRKLAYVLRHREDWPPGFVWNYRHCTHCAMGLAAAIWPAIGADFSTYFPFVCVERLAMALRIDQSAIAELFAGNHGRISHDDITPEVVAASIDRFLEVQESSNLRPTLRVVQYGSSFGFGSVSLMSGMFQMAN